MAKIRIVISNSEFEFEGEEEFIEKMLGKFEEQLQKQSFEPNVCADQLSKEATKVDKKSSKITKSKRKESYSIIKDLNLLPTNEKSLKDFYTEKDPTTGMEKTATFVYYLKTMLKTTNVGLDHIYTCYKAVGEPVPGALKQNIADTSSRKGYIDTANFEDIQLSTIGENFVEHELPRPKKETIGK